MSGFSNAIVGGMGALIRKFIRSPNYVSGESGWTINQDGSAEFSNIDVRGTVQLPLVTGPGQKGTIWWNDGLAYENAQIFKEGSRLFISGGTDFPGSTDPYIYLDQHDNNSIGKIMLHNVNQYIVMNTYQIVLHQHNQPGLIIAQLVDNSIASTLMGVSDDGTQSASVLCGSTSVNIDGPLHVNSGPTGKYYAEQIYPKTQSLTASTQTLLLDTSTVITTSDYGTCFTANNWTCPETGWYDISFFIAYNDPLTGTYYDEMRINGNLNFLGTHASVTSFHTSNINAIRWLAKGDVLTFLVHPPTATSVFVDRSQVVIARRL